MSKLKGKFAGTKNPFYGEHHSLESRRKMSNAHKGKILTDEHKRKISDAIKGDTHYNWKGGRKKRTDGYVYIHSPNHPFKQYKNYVFEHRLVMEQWLRENEPNHLALIEIDGVKYLRRNWISHHINKLRDDNRIENLKVMTFYEHRSFHSKGKRNPMFGRHHSDETKRKISDRYYPKGKVNPLYGRHLSEETKRKISIAKKRRGKDGENNRKKKTRN